MPHRQQLARRIPAHPDRTHRPQGSRYKLTGQAQCDRVTHAREPCGTRRRFRQDQAAEKPLRGGLSLRRSWALATRSFRPQLTQQLADRPRENQPTPRRFQRSSHRAALACGPATLRGASATERCYC
eukprot:762937-Prymnesium_polylepis.2